MSRAGIRDGAISLSLANLCFLNVWDETQDYSVHYYQKTPSTGYLLGATICSVLLLAGVFWIALRLFSHIRSATLRHAARVSLLAFLLIPLNFARMALHVSAGSVSGAMGKGGALAAGAAAAVGLALAIARRRQVVWNSASTILIVMLPLFPVALARAACGVYLADGRAAFAPRQAAAAEHHPARTRVVWIVFDELDERLLFEQRPAGLQLPEFDRLRQEALVASAAYAPGGDTSVSLPALTIGELVMSAEIKGADELRLTLKKDGRVVSWKDAPTIFGKAHAMGMRSAVAGWFHPYCRILGQHLADCAWEPAPWPLRTEEHARKLGFGRTLLGQAQREIRKTPLAPWFHLEETPNTAHADGPMRRIVWEEQAAAYRSITRSALAAVGDTSLDLVFLHFPVPHPIGIYNRSKQAFTADESNSYIDNLALADRTLGEVRRAMEEAGGWDSDAIVVSSDHPLRTEMWRQEPGWTEEMARITGNAQCKLVPYLLKLPGQRSRQAYRAPFNTVLTADLVLQILTGEVRTAQDASEWLDRRRGGTPLG